MIISKRCWSREVREYLTSTNNEITMPRKTTKGRKRKNGMTDVEKVVRAVQGAAAAGVVLYKVVKPHLHKLRRKKKELK